ncbi:hypothetical protein Z517_02318 [Fonsecaea pedrosoi CBS 271.37]|uniref:Unplaced genomic scaffold supercont1.2, whole genome shotgun sequence n=1 Tax=Fonsecaea pedrosoi CBS 271.37 TaxID=1442368 RepID=A0A0D2GWU1_9EURO|nr:uncharacterized protein Z517_02318 [Fonsecaea pedrosoi CBS 271.37]KIW83075.1 hypothetical protein Z517_02318 [Fonsecaea pedrosoi CBS 271.37]
MAQRKSTSQNVDDQAQSDNDLDMNNPRLLMSELTKAFEEVAQAESTASALEAKLDGIHKQLDQLLASFEQPSESSLQEPSSKPSDAK